MFGSHNLLVCILSTHTFESPMETLPHHGYSSTPFWAFPNLVGLDAPMVAVCWQWIFAELLGISLPWMVYLILALSAWSIYLGDRLVDVARSRALPFNTNRHRFTARHCKALIFLLTAVAGTNLILISIYLPVNLIVTGCFTSGLIAIYYLIRLTKIRKYVSLIPRELLCGMLFSMGCAIGPHAYAPNHSMQLAYLLVVVLFGLLCSASCVLISIWEKDSDHASKDPSVVSSQKEIVPHIAKALVALAAIAAVLSIFVFVKALLAIALAAVFLNFTLRFQDRLSLLTRRVLADAVLLTPLIFVLF